LIILAPLSVFYVLHNRLLVQRSAKTSRAYSCRPQYRFRKSENSSCSLRDNLRLTYCISFAGDSFDSAATNMWIWSGEINPV
jgi:hypothetical protein